MTSLNKKPLFSALASCLPIFVLICGGVLAVGPSGAQTPGSLLWSYAAAGGATASPAVAPESTVYFVGGSYLYAFSPDGTNKWKTTTGTVYSSPSIAPDRTIYIGSYTDGRLYAISTNGTTNWTFATGGPIQCSPAVDRDGTILFGSADGFFYALNPNGTKKWDFATGDVGRASPSIARDGSIYIGTQTNRLFALSREGALKWSFDLPNPIRCAPAIGADGTIYCTFNYEVGYPTPRGLIALSADGAERWRQASQWPASSPVVGSDGTIYVVGFGLTQLIALNPANGNPQWVVGGGFDGYLTPPGGPAVASDGTVYYGGIDSGGETYFYAINSDGTTNWTYRTGFEIVTSPAVATNGTVYFGAGTTFYAIKGAAPLANSPWPKYKQNLRNTGRVEAPSLQKPQKRGDGGFQFQLVGELGQSYTVQTSTSLTSWSSLTSLLVTNLPMDVVDAEATNFPSRFYRALSP